MLGLIPTEKGADLVFHLGRSEYANESGPGGPPFRDSEIKGGLASFRQKKGADLAPFSVGMRRLERPTPTSRT